MGFKSRVISTSQHEGTFECDSNTRSCWAEILFGKVASFFFFFVTLALFCLTFRPAVDDVQNVQIVCVWCQKEGVKRYSLCMGSELKSFCSEKCFAACRRAYFKRNKVGGSGFMQSRSHFVTGGVPAWIQCAASSQFECSGLYALLHWVSVVDPSNLDFNYSSVTHHTTNPA